MNTISKLLIASFFSLSLFSIQSCVKDDDYSVPSLECPKKAEPTTSIKELLTLVSTNSLKKNEKGFVEDNLIIQGIIISSDQSGNISNTISIQDRANNPEAGIQIELLERPLYGFYPIGSTVQVHLKGLKVQSDRGVIKIGTKIYNTDGTPSTNYEVDRIPKDIREKVFIKTCDQIEKVVPKEVNSIAEALKNENVNTLVKIKNVQFKSPKTALTYYPSGSTSSADNVRLIDSNGRETDLRTSKYADFKDEKLTENSGDITVLVSKYNSSYQLYIRDIKDVNFDQPRFGEASTDCSELSQPNITLSELTNKIEKGTIKVDNNNAIAEDLLVHAYVISNDETGNFFKTISLQDAPNNPSSGIQIEVDKTDLYKDFPLGSKVQINLKGLVGALDKGVIKLGSVDNEYPVGRIKVTDIKKYLVKSCQPLQNLTPKVVSNLKEALKPENINTLITVNNVQFKNPTVDKTYGVSKKTVNRILEDNTGNIAELRNSGYAKWYAQPLPEQSGNITFIVSRYNTSYQLYIRDTNDVNFNLPRFEEKNEDYEEIKGSVEDFESQRKTNYSTNNISLSTGSWTFSEGGIFAASETRDLKSSGSGSVRLRGKNTQEAYIQTNFYVKNLKLLKFYFGGTNFNEGTDSDKEIKLEVFISTDYGTTWTSAGDKIGEKGKMNLFELPIKVANNAKVMVKIVNKSFMRSTDNRLRINIDDVQFIN